MWALARLAGVQRPGRRAGGVHRSGAVYGPRATSRHGPVMGEGVHPFGQPIDARREDKQIEPCATSAATLARSACGQARTRSKGVWGAS